MARETLSPELNSTLLGLLFVYPFSFALDFKGNAGGSVLQFGMAAGVSMVFALILLFGRAQFTRATIAFLVSSITVISLGCIVAVYNSVQLALVIRVTAPFLLFVSGLYVSAIALDSPATARALFFGMVGASLLSLLFRFYYATSVAGVSIDEMRYQTLSPTLPTMIGFAAAQFCFQKRVTPLVLCVSIGTMAVIALSITRSYLITVVFALASVPLLLRRMSSGNPLHVEFSRGRARRLWAYAGAIFVGFALAAWLRPGMIVEWQTRLLNSGARTTSGYDVNAITRLAEAAGIWEAVTEESSMGLVFGKGFGNFYQWSFDYSSEVRTVSEQMVNIFFAPTWEAAHSPYTYALFFGGLPALAWQIAIFVMPIYIVWTLAANLRKFTDHDVLMIFAFNAFSALFYFSQTFTSNPLGERMSGQFLGLSVGVILAMARAPFNNPGARRRL